MASTNPNRAVMVVGLLTVAMYLTAIGLLPVHAPTSASSGHQIAIYASQHRSQLLAGYLTIALGLAVLLIFAAGLHRIIRRAEPADGWLAMASVTSAVGGAAIFGVGTALFMVAAYRPTTAPAVIRAFWDAGWLAYNIAGFGFVAWITIITIATLRHHALPRWSAWVAIPVAAINFVGPFAVQQGSGAFSPQGWFAMVVALTFAVWLLIVAIAGGAAEPNCTHRFQGRTMKQMDSTEFDMSRLDVTTLNVAVERVLAHTCNPRHRYLLQSYVRHRYLETAGRWEEILDPALTTEHPFYRFSLLGQPPFSLDGRDQVAALYRHWAETDQCIFYVEDERVAVGDHMVVARATAYQQTLGGEVAGAGPDIDDNAVYLTRSQIMMLWPYDDQCRLLGEDVWEFDDADKALIKLDPAHVLTATQAAKVLHPYIKPLPAFEDSFLPA